MATQDFTTTTRLDFDLELREAVYRLGVRERAEQKSRNEFSLTDRQTFWGFVVPTGVIAVLIIWGTLAQLLAYFPHYH